MLLKLTWQYARHLKYKIIVYDSEINNNIMTLGLMLAWQLTRQLLDYQGGLFKQTITLLSQKTNN